MKFFENGKMRQATPEEIAEMQAIEQIEMIHEKTHFLTDSEIFRLDMHQRINSLNIDNATAGRMIDYFPTRQELFADGELIPVKTRIRDDKNPSIIWRATVDLWNTDANSPENAPTLWDKIEYRDNIRIIPQVFTATLAYMKDELGYYEEHIYQSLMDGNVFPVTQTDAWKLLR